MRLAPKLALNFSHIVVERFTHDFAMLTHYNCDPRNGKRATGRRQARIIGLMCACCYPLHSQLIAAYNTPGYGNVHVGHRGKACAFSIHDGLATNKRLWIHAILDDGIFMVVMLQLLDITRGLMDKMIIVLPDVQLSVIISRYGLSSMRSDLTSSDLRNSACACHRKTHQGQPLYQSPSIHFSRADIINHLWNCMFFLLFLILHTSP